MQFLVIARGPSTFCDEVEVFRGPSSLLDQTSGLQVTDVKQFVRARKLGLVVRRRYDADVVSLEAAIRAARLSPAAQSRLLGRLSDVSVGLQRAASEPQPGPSRFILPFGKDHEKLFAFQAELWKATGCPPLSAWVPSTWDPVPLFGLPPRPGGQIEVHVMRGEYRAAAVNLANSGPDRLHVALRWRT